MSKERSREESGDRTSVAEARAAAQVAAKAGKVERDAALARHFDGPAPGRPILVTSNVATALFVVATGVAVVVDDRTTRLGAAVVDLGLFAVGCVLFLVALYQGAQRSRESAMTMSGWWFLAGSAPRSVRLTLLGGVTAQTAVGLAGAFARPFTALAFGVLVPTFGLALCGWWGALHGFFPRRTGV